MTFWIGQKVICIEPKCGDVGGITEPDKGDVATVVNTYVAYDDTLMLELAEFPAPPTLRFDVGWPAVAFRPALLNTKQRENALCGNE